MCHFACFQFYSVQPKQYLEVAEKAASFIRKNLYNPNKHRLHHSFRNGPSKAPGFLDDYAFLISGLLDLYEFGGSIFWLAWAMELQDTQVRTLGLILLLCCSILISRFLFYSNTMYSSTSFFLIKMEGGISIHPVKILPFSFELRKTTMVQNLRAIQFQLSI